MLLLVGKHFLGYIGHYGYDDIHYAELSYDFSRGVIDYDDHYSYRTPLIVFTALSYSIFGVSDLSSAIPTILISILILLLLYSILKDKDIKTLIAGLSLTVFSNWFFFYSDKLMPDMYVALFAFASLVIIHNYKYSASKRSPLAYSILFSVSLLLGFMSKGTIILIIPLLAYLMVTDIIFKRDIKFWLFSLLSGIVVFSLYFFIIWILTGDVFKRFDAIEGNSYLNLCSYDSQSSAILLKRIAYEFFKVLVYQGMGTGFILSISYLFRKRVGQHFLLKDSFSFWFVSALILLLSSNFMTISLGSYSPMCLDPRHYLFLVPIVSIPASIIFTRFLEEKSAKLQLLIVSAIFSFAALFLQGNTFWQLYMPLTLLVAFYIFLKPNKFNQKLFLFLFVSVLIIKPAHLVLYARKVDYSTQKEIFRELMLDRYKDEKYVMISNAVQTRLAKYYNGFEEKSDQQFVRYDEFHYDSTDNKKKILFLNWYTRYLSGLSNEDLPYYAKYFSPADKKVFEDNELNINIYELDDLSVPETTGKTLIHTLNDFEEEHLHWNHNPQNLSKEKSYEGEQSYRMGEFSGSFEYPMDSISIHEDNYLVIVSKLYYNSSDKTDAGIVVSLEDKEGIYLWKNHKVNKNLHAYSNWWPVKYELRLQKEEIKENSLLKVYLWNPSKTPAYLDNFEVELVEMG